MGKGTPSPLSGASMLTPALRQIPGTPEWEISALLIAEVGGIVGLLLAGLGVFFAKLKKRRRMISEVLLRAPWPSRFPPLRKTGPLPRHLAQGVAEVQGVRQDRLPQSTHGAQSR